MHRFADEVAVGVLERRLVVAGGESFFRPGEIESDHRIAVVLREFDRGAREFERGGGEHLFRRRVGHHLENLFVVGRHVFVEETERAQDQAVVAGDVGSVAHGGGLVVFLFRPVHALADGLDNLFHAEVGIDVQLGGESDFDVTHAFGEVILDEFITDALEVFRRLHHRAGVGKALQIIPQILVLVLKHLVAQTAFGHRR